ncbi:MAG: class I SAM-dependent methyltransferase [Ignavibacteriae bacterium]|nr:MAG: class I SAM-dependent methyltransferase [Ignavibacteriota bacterium]
MEKKYYYNDVMVNFYDIIHTDYNVDKKFYLDKILNAGGPVLEIGCGTGRIFCDALKEGADIYGIDQSELMLKKLKEKIDFNEYCRVQVIDALDYISEKKFKLIIAPFRMFMHILTVKDQLKFLKNVYENLADDGEYVFNIFNPDPERIKTGDKENLRYEAEYLPGRIFKFYDMSQPDLLNQCQLVTFRFEWDDNGEMKEDIMYFPMRYMFRFEIQHLCERAGFRKVNIYRDFDYNELNGEIKEFVVICKK